MPGRTPRSVLLSFLSLVPLLAIQGCVCPAGGVDCAGACVDLQSSATDCGACGNACGASEICVAAHCVCEPGSAWCDGACRDVTSDRLHCGSCGVACPAGASCSSGECACPSGLSPCGDRCLDLTSTTSCGSCGNVCATGADCIGGECTCPDGGDACGAVCRDLSTDDAHCGACDEACTGGASCVDFACTCPAGTDQCPNGCVDLQTDERNCGACRAACPPTATCTDGACLCPAGETECSGSCVDTTRNEAHCGGCGHVCPADATCEASECHPRFVFALGAPSTVSFSSPWDAAVAVDDAENVVLAHSVEGGATTLASYDRDGAPRWSRSLSGVGNRVGGVCTEPVTNRVAIVYGTGSDANVMIVVVDSAGATAWSRTLTGSRMHAGSCAFGTDGTLAVAGAFGGTVDFGGRSLTDVGFGDAFVATYASDGALSNVLRLGTGTTDDPAQVAVATDGDLVIASQTGGVALTIGGTAVRDAYVARVHADGSLVWATSMPFDVGGGALPYGRPVVSESGDVFVSGVLENTTTMTRSVSVAGLSHSVAGSTAEIAVVALGPTGAGRWIEAIPCSYVQSAPNLAIAGNGLVLVAGSYSDPFTSHELPRTAASAGFVVALRPSGGVVWSRTFDSGEVDYGLDVGANGERVAMAGRADVPIDLGGGRVTLGRDDVWLSVWVP